MMIKVGDILEGYEVTHITTCQALLLDQKTRSLYLGTIRGDTLFVDNGGAQHLIPLTPCSSQERTVKPVYNGAFGESVEEGSNKRYWMANQHHYTGRFEPRQYNAAFHADNVFTTKEACQSYCDALNCLQIDLRENSVEPLDGVEQWSLEMPAGKLITIDAEQIGYKLIHALPWYETKEEAEKHLADSERIIESLKTMKGIK